MRRLAPTSWERNPAALKMSFEARGDSPWPAPRSMEGRLTEEVSS